MLNIYLIEVEYLYKIYKNIFISNYSIDNKLFNNINLYIYILNNL